MECEKVIPPLTSPLVQIADKDRVVIMQTIADMAMMSRDKPKYKQIDVFFW